MRVAMFVYGDVTHDARVLREAATLGAAGHEVTVLARPADSAQRAPDRESRAGFAIVRVPVPDAWRRRWTLARYPWRLRGLVTAEIRDGARRLPGGAPAIGRAVIVGLAAAGWSLVCAPLYLVQRRRRTRPGADPLDWYVRWRGAVGGWARAAARAAPTADVYHGHDLTGLLAAVAATGERAGTGPAASTGRRVAVVYDSHEIFLEARSAAEQPAWIRRRIAAQEREAAARAEAVITVNDLIADELGRRLAPRRTVVLHNCPPAWSPPEPRPDLIRATLGISAESVVALYHGAFARMRGIEQFAESLLVPGTEAAHAVLLGFGPMRPTIDRMALDPRYRGRLHVLDGVLPGDLLPWVASADVGVIAVQPSTLNHRLSTPNKLFECMAAGTPVIVSDFPAMRRVVLEDPSGPLGVVCDPTSPSSIAGALRWLVEQGPDDRAALRARCLSAAHARWNWEYESRGLLDLYGELAGRIEAGGRRGTVLDSPDGRPGDGRGTGRGTGRGEPRG